MRELTFRSGDGRFRLVIPATVVRTVLTECLWAGHLETGGILVGTYNDNLNTAQVTAALPAPDDSRAGKSWFYRGVRGLRRYLRQLWRAERAYYLGEWHFHPFSLPMPSPTDITQMAEIAEESSYQCPEPILLIIGGDPSEAWTARAFVSLQRVPFIELYHVNEHARNDVPRLQI